MSKWICRHCDATSDSDEISVADGVCHGKWVVGNHSVKRSEIQTIPQATVTVSDLPSVREKRLVDALRELIAVARKHGHPIDSGFDPEYECSICNAIAPAKALLAEIDGAGASVTNADTEERESEPTDSKL